MHRADLGEAVSDKHQKDADLQSHEVSLGFADKVGRPEIQKRDGGNGDERGGGLLRDVLSRENPIIFQPGQLYAVAATTGVGVLLTLGVGFKVHAWVAAIACIATTFVIRILTLVFDIRTHPMRKHAWRAKARHGVKSTIHRLRNR